MIWLCRVLLFLSFICFSDSFEIQQAGSDNICSWSSRTILRWPTNDPTSYWECNIGYLCRCWCPLNMVFDNRTLECQFLHRSSTSAFSITPATKLPMISPEISTPRKLPKSKELTTTVSTLPQTHTETEDTESSVYMAASSETMSSVVRPSLVSLKTTPYPIQYPKFSTKASRAPKGCINFGIAWFCPRNQKQRFHWNTPDPRQYWECYGNNLYRCWCPSKHVFHKETLKCHLSRLPQDSDDRVSVHGDDRK